VCCTHVIQSSVKRVRATFYDVFFVLSVHQKLTLTCIAPTLEAAFWVSGFWPLINIFMPTEPEREFAVARARAEYTLGHRHICICFWCTLKLPRRLSFKCEACLDIGGKKIRYCGEECQRKHWQAVHKYTCCQTIQRNSSSAVVSESEAAAAAGNLLDHDGTNDEAPSPIG